MLMRSAAFFTSLIIIILNLSGWLQFAQDDAQIGKIQNRKTATTCCCLKKNSSSARSCRAQANTSLGSPVAKLCCKTVCGEQSGEPDGIQPQTTGQQNLIAPIANAEIVPAKPALPAGLLDPYHSVYNSSFYSNPPALYLHHSSFLI